MTLRRIQKLVLILTFFISFNVFAACTSTLSNTSQNSTTTLQDTSSGQCLINYGAIAPIYQTYGPYGLSDSVAINSSFSNYYMLNSGTINLIASSSNATGITTDGDIGGASISGGSILNSGIITGSGTNDIYAIWPFTGTGIITSIINSGQILLTNSGQSVGIFNYARNVVNLLENTGTISTTGNLYAIGNNSEIKVFNNSGLITTSGTSNVISNNNVGDSIIDTLTNTGTISATRSGYYGIRNNHVINTLNNSQGDGNTAGALTYTGILPTNYNIIINDSDHYGQLSGTSVTGSTAFGISANSLITSRLYTGVLQGLADGRVSAVRTGTYDNMSWTLALQSGSSTNWDLTFSGASLTQTQISLAAQAQRLRSVFNSTIASSNFANMNTYDCNLFDQNNMCISAGGRYTSIDNPSSNHSAAVVTLGYKVSPNIRIGAFLDQSVNNNTPTGINISNKNPMMGAFAVWNKNADGLGYQVKLANAYQDKDVTTTRDAEAISEAGTGKTNLNTQSYVGELSYAFQYQDSTIVRPYFAVRYSNIKQDAYTEDTSASVTAPLTYAKLGDRSTTALMGVKLNHSLTSRTNLTASLGAEQDLDHQVDKLTATGVAGLTSENFNNNIKRTRPVASAGAYYAVAKNQRLSGEVYYQQLPFQSTGSATAYFNYMIGF
jgi:hypothetical protein